MVEGGRIAPAVRQALDDGAEGRVPPNIALMRALMAARSPAEIDQALATARQGRDDAALVRLDTIAALAKARPDAWALVRDVLASANHDGAPGDQSPARWATIFDRLAAVSPDAGVALYALGDPDLLSRATQEIVARLREWGLLGPQRDAIEIGCGAGRFVQALAPLLRSVAGLDISGAMIAEARRRCAGLHNVRLDVGTGEGLAGYADASADLVLAVDVFPYLVLQGQDLVGIHVAEAARVLRPGGSLLVLNYSYRGDPDLDRADVTALATRYGFEVRRFATGDFILWDGSTNWLVKE